MNCWHVHLYYTNHRDENLFVLSSDSNASIINYAGKTACIHSFQTLPWPLKRTKDLFTVSNKNAGCSFVCFVLFFLGGEGGASGNTVNGVKRPFTVMVCG